MDLSDVTAVIPIHKTTGNREWLQQAVNSVGVGVEILVMENDGSVAEARNHGLREATTEYVLFLDADDVAAPRMVTELRSAVWDVDVAYPEMVLVTEDLKGVCGHHLAQPFCANRLLQGNFVPGCAMVRRQAVLAVGGFRELPLLEDWDLWVRMSRNGARFKAVSDARLFYRQVEGSRNKNMDVDWDAVAREIVGGQTVDAKATFYFSPTPAVAHLRCAMPAKYLPGVAREGLDVAFNDQGEHRFIGHEGAAVFQLGASKTEALVGAQMKADGIRVLVESDDNYFAGGAKRFRDLAQWGGQIGAAAHTVEGHRAIVENADGVIVTTRYLADRYRKFNPNIFVCPNQIDPDDWQPLTKPDDGVFRIGWFASGSHVGDAKLVQRGLEWASRQKDVEVITLGLDARFPFKHQKLAWTNDLSKYRLAMHQLNLGVAPVTANDFSRGRSDLKWLEMSMGAAASVVSDVESYETVPDGLALKATDPAGFLSAIRYLVQNRDEARAMGAAAREYVLERRTMKANVHLWDQAVAA